MLMLTAGFFKIVISAITHLISFSTMKIFPIMKTSHLHCFDLSVSISFPPFCLIKLYVMLPVCQKMEVNVILNVLQKLLPLIVWTHRAFLEDANHQLLIS